MTRKNLLSGFLAAPLSALFSQKASGAELPDHAIHFGPSTYIVGAGGRISITGVGKCRIENCHFIPTPRTE